MMRMGSPTSSIPAALIEMMTRRWTQTRSLPVEMEKTMMGMGERITQMTLTARLLEPFERRHSVRWTCPTSSSSVKEGVV